MEDIGKALNLAMYLVLSLVVLAIMVSFGATTQTKILDMSSCGFVTTAMSGGAVFFNATTHVCQNGTGYQFVGGDVNITAPGLAGMTSFGSFMPTIFLIGVIIVVLVMLLSILKVTK